QVGALARKRGLRVAKVDLIRFARDKWPAVLAECARRCNPRAVGFHIRQTDSLNAREYGGDAPEFHPLRETRACVESVRSVTSAPVVCGGFGFTLRPAETLSALGADLGVVGEPDDFLTEFEAFAERRLDVSKVANVIAPGGRGEAAIAGPRV